LKQASHNENIKQLLLNLGLDEISEFHGLPKPAAVSTGESMNPLTQEANRQG